MLWGGWPFFERGWASFVTRRLNMFSLISIGTAAAFGFSLLALLFPALVALSSVSVIGNALRLRRVQL